MLHVNIMKQRFSYFKFRLKTNHDMLETREIWDFPFEVFAEWHEAYSHIIVYLKATKRSIPCAPLLSLNDSTVLIAAAELLAYN